MRNLTIKEISRLGSRVGVKKIAVENFLMSMGTNAYNAEQNLRLDTYLYNWNATTTKAISDGIKLAKRG